MRVKTFEKLLADRSGLTESEMDGRARGLRDKGYLIKGGRGPHAPTLTAESAAVLMLAAAGATQISDAVFAVANSENLFPEGGGQSLKDCLIEILDDPEKAGRVDRVVIGRYPNRRWAEVIGKRRRGVKYTPRREQPSRGDAGICFDATITGDFLAEVAAIIARIREGIPQPGTSGWSGDLKARAEEAKGGAKT